MSLARVLGPEIRVNVVAPGYVRYAVAGRARTAQAGADELEREIRRARRRSRRRRAEDVAEAIAWLIEGARRVTGEIIYVDGGMHIASPRR